MTRMSNLVALLSEIKASFSSAWKPLQDDARNSVNNVFLHEHD